MTTVEKSLAAFALILSSVCNAHADEALVRRHGCLECHAAEQHGIGPSLQAIAARYKNEPAARRKLIAKLEQGAKGNWTDVTGGVPMPPYARRLSDAEMQQLIDWILSL